jgi:hypothetical protein
VSVGVGLIVAGVDTGIRVVAVAALAVISVAVFGFLQYFVIVDSIGITADARVAGLHFQVC